MVCVSTELTSTLLFPERCNEKFRFTHTAWCLLAVLIWSPLLDLHEPSFWVSVGCGDVGRRGEGKENSEGVGLRWELSSERMEAGRGEIFGDEMGSGGLRLIAEKKPSGPCAEKKVKRSKE